MSEKKTLLHVCCAPCSVSCITTLRAEGIEPVGYWYNPNIHPYMEYAARRDCLVDYAKRVGMPLYGGSFKTQTLENLAIVLEVSTDFIMHGQSEEKLELLSEAVNVLSDMDKMQLRQCIAMMKAMKSITAEM